MRQWCMNPCEWLAFRSLLGARATLAATARRVRVAPVPRCVMQLERRALLLEHLLQPGSSSSAGAPAMLSPESAALQAEVCALICKNASPPFLLSAASVK